MKCGLWKWLLEHPMDTANLPTNINYGFRRVWLKHNLDYKDWNSHAPREFPQNSTQAMSVGVMLVGGLGVLHGPSRFKRWGQTNIHAYTYIYIYISVYLCIIYVYVCIYIYIYIYVYEPDSRRGKPYHPGAWSKQTSGSFAVRPWHFMYFVQTKHMPGKIGSDGGTI